ncbi:MAG TPA: potassium channel family protein [Caulobacteraceae bacterium]|jgi:hypothetical protein|nr:potassium channel family protein [Caulobacteraceae bacterium]
MTAPTSLIALLCGVALIGVVLQDAFEVVLLPRRVKRRYRFTALFFGAAWRLWSRFGALWPAGGGREKVLSVFGPLGMLALFVAWAIGLVGGFGLIQWALEPHNAAGGPHSFFSAAYMSGVTFFTLGYGDVTPVGGAAKALAVVEAGVGFGLIAVVIGYLPVLYQLFSRREAHVLQLDARAGSPPTAAVLLRRHIEAGSVARLDEVFRAWEIWGAELLESHLSYPMLAYYRSQHDDQSWLAALGAVLDACVLVMVAVEEARPLQARMTFAILRQVIVEMGRSLHVSPARGGAALPLDREVYARLAEDLGAAGLAWNAGEEAAETLAALRATYVPLLDAIAAHLLIPLPGLAPSEHTSDHWDQGPRGLIARKLVEGLAEGGPEPDVLVLRRRSAVARLRDRLRGQ